MVAADENSHTNGQGMSEKTWTLDEIRKAYGEIWRAYNELYRSAKTDREEIFPDVFNIEHEGRDSLIMLRKKAIEAIPKLKEAADRSGNAVVWHAGEPLDILSKGLKERIERALEFGF